MEVSTHNHIPKKEVEILRDRMTFLLPGHNQFLLEVPDKLLLTHPWTVLAHVTPTSLKKLGK